MSAQNLVKQVRRQAVPLPDVHPLIDRVSKAKVVMLGEASHGTHEFYRWRQNISEILISDHGFRFVAVEGDWPAAQQVNKRLLLSPNTRNRPSAAEVLKEAFTRWPTWMWANRETESLVTWMADFNSKTEDRNRMLRFFGLDVYSLFDSIQVVIDELEKVDAELARSARKNYACFDPSDRDENRYMKWLLEEAPDGCRSSVLCVLREVLQRRLEDDTSDEVAFDIRHNAKIVRDAEEYYRMVLFGEGEGESWNVRDNHMMDTLVALLDRCPDDGKAIVWAHNTHVGDYMATSMVDWGHVNLGGLARQRYGMDDVALVGFGTYEGEVVAAYHWGGAVERMLVPAARAESYDDIFHRAAAGGGAGEEEEEYYGQFYVILREMKEAEGNRTLAEMRGQRAIRVVYDPAREKRCMGNYVPSRLSGRYDAFVFTDKSNGVEPLGASPDPTRLPELWPVGT